VAEAELAFAPPVLLTEGRDAAAFACGEAVLDEWLRERAWHNLQVRASRTYVVCPVGDRRIVGYFALSMGQILAHEVLGAMRRNMPKNIPAVVLGRLAIDRTCQGQGLGRAMLADAVSRSLRAASEVSARLIVVHAISTSAESFYRHHGFSRLPVETPTYGLDLLKLQKLVRDANPQ
jgi:GNAT superfamily N-acetyltransferase